jgi:lysozyme
MSIIEGVDVSAAQRPSECDWRTAHDAGLSFAWVKVSEGRDFADGAADAHLDRLSLTPGMLSGGYHFARPDNRFKESSDGRLNGATEAAWAAAQAMKVGAVGSGFLPFALDLEKYTERGEVTTAQRDDFARGFIDEFEAITKTLPCVYTGPTFWGYQHSPEFAEELHARGVMLWLVQYGSGPDPDDTIPGWPWGVWQWSGGRKFEYADPWPGLPSPIDRNRYRGTLAELRARVG